MEITQVRFPLMVVIVCYIYLNISVFLYLPPKESIGRTDRFMAGASSDISEEMIRLLFFECFQTEPLPLSKIGVRIIHKRALYMGKYGA